MTATTQDWTCISHCGACCRLCPEERPEALAALSEAQRHQYLSMVGEDGWCIHFDTGGRRCRIYADRPEFCRVSHLGDLFAVPDHHLDQFAICCCRQQIRTTYGGRSLTMRQFDRAQRNGSGGDE